MARKAPTQKKSQPSSSTNIPLSHPDRSGPKAKTLLELAQERGILDPKSQKLKDGSIPKNATRIHPDEDDIGRLGNSLLWSISLAMLHFTFDVLTQHQYNEVLVWPQIAKRGFEAFLGVSSPLPFPSPINRLTKASNLVPLLHLPHPPRTRSLRPPHPRTREQDYLFRRQYCGRLLSDTYHECVQLLRDTEAGPACRCALDLVCLRTRSELGDLESSVVADIFEGK